MQEKIFIYHKNSTIMTSISHQKALLFNLNRASVSDKVKRGLAVLRSFVGSLSLTIGDVTFGMGIEPERGTADSGTWLS